MVPAENKWYIQWVVSMTTAIPMKRPGACKYTERNLCNPAARVGLMIGADKGRRG
ncbi:MAG: hypothetical protein ACK5VP_04300 [Betaproteobacteria bacterium]|jgi:hypothetical protein